MNDIEALGRVSTLVSIYTGLGRDAPMSVQTLDPASLQDFRAAFRAIGEEALSQEALQARVGGSLDVDNLPAYILSKWQQTLAEQFFDGSTVLVAPFPCNLNGKAYSKDEVKQGNHIHVVAVDESTRHGAHGDSMFAVLPQQVWSAGSFRANFDRDTANQRIANAEHTRNFLREILAHFRSVADILK